MHDATESTAFMRFREGDAQAFDEVVAQYRQPAYATALKILGDAGQAEEAVQEAFLRIWRNSHRFEAGRGSERTWLLSVVRNQAIDTMRRRNRRGEVDIEAVPALLTLRDPSDPLAQVEHGSDAEMVRRALEHLPAEQRGAIQLVYYGEMRPPEVSRLLGIPEGTVRSRVRLGLAKLRELLPAREFAAA